MSNNPYIIREIKQIIREYNPEYGDERVCQCGHQYHRHFDSYENMEPVGCKYCGCYEFIEKSTEVDEKLNEMLTILNSLQPGWSLNYSYKDEHYCFVNPDKFIYMNYYRYDDGSELYEFKHNSMEYVEGSHEESIIGAYVKLKESAQNHLEVITSYINNL